MNIIPAFHGVNQGQKVKCFSQSYTLNRQKHQNVVTCLPLGLVCVCLYLAAASYAILF